MLAQALDTTTKRIAAAAVALLILAVGVALALVSGGGADPAPTTTTAAPTTSAPTTTVPGPTAPLLGLPGDPALIGRPALVVKIDNVEPKARPQAGINQADVVYEERVEGSVTRFLAIYHSTDAAPVGPVRSARTSDLGILASLHRPFYAWSGANNIFAARIREANLADVGYDRATSHYYRAGDRPAPHNLMLKSTVELMALPNEGSSPPPALFTYRAAETPEPAHLERVGGVGITYGTSAGAAPVEYRWTGVGWARFQKGTPHVDAAGTQIAPENVIVQFTPYASSGVNDQFGKPIPEAQLVGSGEAWVLTAGGLVVAQWHKATLDAVTTYTDVDGTPIGLTPGRTWVALVPPGEATRL
ncbi:MAG: DUF3048 domain-containing protein [Acidimicrobiales bacterium]